LVGVALGLTLWFVYELRGVFLPILVALGLAYLFHPLITRAQRQWKWPRPLTITLILILFAAAVAAFLAWLGPLLMDQVQTLARKAPQYLQAVSGRYGIEAGAVSDQVLAWMARVQEDPIGVLQQVFTGTGHALGILGAVIGTTSYIAVTALLLPIYFFFFAWRFDRVVDNVTRVIPASRRPETFRIMGKIDQAVAGFFWGRVVIGLITAVLYAAGWAWTSVPYWFLLGGITGLLTIVPYVSAIGWPLAILLKYLDSVVNAGAESGDWLAILVLPSLPYLVVQFIESWWLTPWIEGHTTDLSSVTVIIVVFIGGAVAGFLGLLLAIPLAASLKILFTELVLPRWEAWAARR
jgi:predicted PurR-regulated permease PerM